MPAAHQLPSELHENIIDSADFKAANQCALVSKAWLQRARYMWWSGRPITLCFWNDELDCRTKIVMDLITHPHCTFVHLYAGLSIQGPDRRLQFPEQETADYTKLNSILWSISKIPIKFNNIALYNLSINQLQPSSRVILSSFEDVTWLELGSVKFPSMSDLCSFAASFPLLHTLNVELWDPSPLWPATLPQSRPEVISPLSFRSIREMSLKVTGNLNAFVAALQCHHCPVEEITLRNLTIGALGPAYSLLFHIGATLKILNLHANWIGGLFDPDWFPAPSSAHLLYQNTNLTYLTIHSILVHESHSYPEWWLTPLLGSITSQTFKNLELKSEMDSSSNRCLKQFDWSELDNLCLVQCNPLLEHIGIEIKAHARARGHIRSDHIADLALAVRSQLPKLVATGKLEVIQSASDVHTRNGFY